MKNRKLILKGVKKVDHAVFSVGEDGLKVYRDYTLNRNVPYGSGQQLKRSIIDRMLENMDVERQGVEFRWKLSKKALKEDVAITTCNPEHECQLFSGYLNTDAEIKARRTSPLSISAFTPVHPYLAGINIEEITFDRVNDRNSVVTLLDDDNKILQESEILDFLTTKGIPEKINNIKKSKYIQDNKRANGLFNYEIEIDMSRLFKVEYRLFNSEVTKERIEELVAKGWSLSPCGNIITYPKDKMLAAIEAIADSLIHWSLETNQSRTFDSSPVFAVSVSDKAYEVNEAIRGELTSEKTAELVLDDTNGSLFTSPIVNGFIMNAHDKTKTLKDAKQLIINTIKNYYEL